MTENHLSVGISSGCSWVKGTMTWLYCPSAHGSVLHCLTREALINTHMYFHLQKKKTEIVSSEFSQTKENNT